MLFTNHKIIFDAERCVGCMLCYKACFIDVIQWNTDTKHPEFRYVEDCEHCNYCEISCKRGCIQVIPDFDSQSFRQSFDRYH